MLVSLTQFKKALDPKLVTLYVIVPLVIVDGIVSDPVVFDWFPESTVATLVVPVNNE